LFNYAILGNGAQPAGYHWINFLFHSVNVLAVFFLALRVVRRRWPAFFIAALWAVHPVLTEAVTNIVGRADLLAAMGVLAGLLFYLKSTEASGSERLAWLAALMAVVAIGVFFALFPAGAHADVGSWLEAGSLSVPRYGAMTARRSQGGSLAPFGPP